MSMPTWSINAGTAVLDRDDAVRGSRELSSRPPGEDQRSLPADPVAPASTEPAQDRRPRLSEPAPEAAASSWHEAGEEAPLKRFAIRERGRIYFVDLDEIQAIEAHGNYLHLIGASSVHRVRDTLDRIERRLDGRFVRIHRSHIVRFDQVRELQFLVHGDCMLQLSNQRRFRVGRRYRARLRALVESSRA